MKLKKEKVLLFRQLISSSKNPEEYQILKECKKEEGYPGSVKERTLIGNSSRNFYGAASITLVCYKGIYNPVF